MGILRFCHCDVKIYVIHLIFFKNLNSGPKIGLSTKFELDQIIILKLIQVSLFFNAKKMM